MLNPDGRLWIDRLSEGLSDTGERLNAADGERIVRRRGSCRKPPRLGRIARDRRAVRGPSAAGGRRSDLRDPQTRRRLFTLNDYVAAGIMTSDQAEALRTAVAARKNILVAGGTSTGKTTLTNALLAEVAKTADRVVLIEDTRELQCLAPNLVALRTKDGVVSLSDLVRSSLRPAPRPHSDRRSPRRRGAGSLEGLGHPPPRRRRHWSAFSTVMAIQAEAVFRISRGGQVTHRSSPWLPPEAETTPTAGILRVSRFAKAPRAMKAPEC
jgi:type IV secretion system protein VirB11